MTEITVHEEQLRRRVAVQEMQRFADNGGFPLEYREVAAGSNIHLIGTAPDGREFGIGYAKANVEDVSHD